MRGGLQSPCGCRILPPDSQLGAVIATAQPPPRARESGTSPVVATVVQEILRPFPPNPPRNRGLFSPRDTLPTSDLNTALQLYAWRIVGSPAHCRITDQKSGEVKKHVFAFEDGGVTPFNNPAYLLYTMATLPEYRLHWPDGKERMSLVSVGTGRVKTGRGLKIDENLLGQAKSVPAALIGSAQWMQDLACRQHGECRHGEPLDSELGDLVRENPRAAFLYSRYDKSIGEAEMEGALKVSKKGFTLDNIELMDFLGEMGQAYAEREVKLEHFE